MIAGPRLLFACAVFLIAGVYTAAAQSGTAGIIYPSSPTKGARYLMAITNDTSDTIRVAIDPWAGSGEHSSCIHLGDETKFSVGYIIQAAQVQFISFWRSDSCSGKQGWLAINERPATSKNQTDDYQQFWFDNDGGFSKHGDNSKYNNYLETFSGPVLGVVRPLTFHILPSTTTTAERAAQSGCALNTALQTMANRVLANPHIGTVTHQKLAAYVNNISSASTTSLAVNYPDTRVYRGPTIPREADAYAGGNIISKAENRLSKLKTPGEIESFWASFGPDLKSAPNAETSTVLKLLATASSDSPPSQFVSLALTESVASSFGTDPYRYAFRLTPNSPVLGLKNCALDTGGEVQYQTMGGSAIHDLYRRSVSSGKWEHYDPHGHQWLASPPPASN